MNTIHTNRGREHRSPRHPTFLLLVSLAVTTAACDLDRLLEVEDPTVAAPGTIATEAAVPTTLNAAVGAFQLAFSGAPGAGSFIDSQVTISGLLADEFHVSESFPTRIDVDQRNTSFANATMLAAYARLQTARRMAQMSADLHARFPGTTDTDGHAHALNLVGFTYVLFGENYCSGVPFSEIADDGAIEFGAPLSTGEILERALASFDAAFAAASAAGSSTQQRLARLGRARTLLNLDRPGDAAAEAAEVPTGFVYQIFHSLASTRQQNGIWAGNQNRRGISLSDGEGGNGLPFRSNADARLPWVAGGVGFDNTTPLFLQQKYPGQASSVILASGVEARLIEAESRLRSGGDWLGVLNQLRAEPPAYYPPSQYPGIGSMAPLVDPGSPEAAVDQLFRERAYWMWLTSHRVGDMRRLMRQYGRTDAEAGWPTGPYFRGDVYGSHVSMLVPFDELNNPSFSEQLPNGCDPSIP
jgi:starch-binding outer membrane protein, SusD/RagB family